MVDRARIKETKEEVYAGDLLRRVLDREDPLNTDIVYYQTNYICLLCNGVMTPVAIKEDRKQNSPAPHFKIKGKHDHNCSFGEYEQLKKEYKKGNKKKQISNNGIFPCPYPDVLDLPELINVSDRTKDTASIGKAEIDISNTNIRVKSIQLLVEHYLLFSNDRDRLVQLHVPQVDVRSYHKVFQRICYRENYYFDLPRIYFGKLLYRKKEINDRTIKLYFTEGIWENKKPIQTMFIEIDISSWEFGEKKNIKTQIEYFFRKRARSNSSLWLFFLGQQDPENNFKFRLLKNDYRLVDCVLGDSLNEEPESDIATPVNAILKDEREYIEKPQLRKKIAKNNNTKPTKQARTTKIVKKKQYQPTRKELSPEKIVRNSQDKITSSSQNTLYDLNKQSYLPYEINPSQSRRKARLKAKNQNIFNNRIFNSIWYFVKSTGKKILSLLFSFWQKNSKKSR